MEDNFDLCKINDFNFNNDQDGENEGPNIFILPSFLSPYSKRIHDKVFINPGIFCKGENGGTYAVLNYFTNNSLKVENKI